MQVVSARGVGGGVQGDQGIVEAGEWLDRTPVVDLITLSWKFRDIKSLVWWGKRAGLRCSKECIELNIGLWCGIRVSGKSGAYLRITDASRE